MEPEFWQERWKAGQIGFHQQHVHPDLIAFEDSFLADGPHRILVPLCGKSIDLLWLVERGHSVVGLELVRSAVDSLFENTGLTPEWTAVTGGMRATAGNLTVFQGDLFKLDLAEIGPVTRIWDRAALVALRPDQRQAYTTLLKSLLAPGGQGLLSVFVYDQSVMSGPPWSVDEATVRSLYTTVTLLSTEDILDDRWRSRGHTAITSSLFRIEEPTE